MKAISKLIVFLSRNKKQALFNMGIKEFGKNYIQAIESFSKAIEIDPEFSESYFFRGNSYYFTGEYSKAIDDLSKAMTLNSAYKDFGFFNRGLMKIKDLNFEGALEDFVETINNKNETAEVYFQSGLAKLEERPINRYGAVVDFSNAIEIDHNQKEFYLQRGLIKIELNDYTGAINDFDRFVKLDPSDPEGFYNRGLSKYHFEKFEDAYIDFQGVLKLNPKHEMAHYMCGMSYVKISDMNSTKQTFRQKEFINGALQHFSRAGELGCTRAYYEIKKYNSMA